MQRILGAYNADHQTPGDHVLWLLSGSVFEPTLLPALNRIREALMDVMNRPDRDSEEAWNALESLWHRVRIIAEIHDQALSSKVPS